MTKMYSPGDKSRAICEHCAKVVGTTFAYRDMPFDDGSGIVKDILAAVCDLCDAVVAVPAQSVPAIRRVREAAEIPIEVRLPAPEVEILDAAALRIDPHATQRFRKAIFTYYLGLLERDPAVLEQVKRGLDDWLCQRNQQPKIPGTSRTPSRRLSFKIAPRTQSKLAFVLDRTGWSRTNLVRGVVMMVQKDILENSSLQSVHDRETIAAAVNG